MLINLKKLNRHWEKGFRYPYPKKRIILSKILNFLDQRFIVEITGIRRVGKTVLMLQTINHLLDKKIDPYHIFYFSFDENQLPIEELLNIYSAQTKIDYRKEKIFVFFDEIQKLKNFQNQIKIYYDLYPNIKFFISGSTSLFIRKKTQESLVGRTLSFLVTPLSFFEYLLFCEKEEIIKNPLLYQKDLEREFYVFLKSQFIDTIKMSSDEERKYYLTSILKKVIFEDLPLVFKFDNPQVLYQIIQYIGQNPGAEINNIHLASEFKISNKTVALYLFYLENSLLVKKLYNFSRNLFTSERKLKKYYLASPSFSWALVDFVDPGKIFENYLISLSSWQYFYRDPAKHEVDFIAVKDNGEIIPIEAKFTKNIKKENFKDLLIFMNKYRLKKGIVFYQEVVRKNIQVKDKTFELIPYFVNPQTI